MASGTEAAPARSGATIVIGATVIAGALGYLIQFGMGVVLSNSDRYTEFMVFWSAFYLVVGAIAGLQQEYARAVATTVLRPELASRGVSARGFGLAAAAIVTLALGLTGPLWGGPVFGASAPAMVLLIALGGGAYVLFSAISGQLYGRERWSGVALGIIADPAIRLVLLAAVLLAAGSDLLLRGAVVLPILLTVLLLLFASRGTGMSEMRLGLGARAIAWNSLRTVGGAVSTAALISGFPVFLKMTVGADPMLATVIFVFTIVRAPVVIPMLALQNLMIVRFTKLGARALRQALGLAAAVIIAALALGLLAGWIGPWLLGLFPAVGFAPSALLVGGMVAAAGVTGALCVTGAAAVAAQRHTGFVLGWFLAALASILLLLLPGGLEQRVLVALSLGPIPGLLVHLLALRGTGGGAGRADR